MRETTLTVWLLSEVCWEDADDPSEHAACAGCDCPCHREATHG